MQPVASLWLSIKASRRLLLIQLAAHLVAAAAVLTSPVPGWLAAALLLPVGASLACLRRSLPVAALRLHGDGRCEMVGADGDSTAMQSQACELEIHPHTLVLSFLVVLLYRQAGRLHAITLLGDSLAGEDFRELRLWLRWHAGAAGQSQTGLRSGAGEARFPARAAGSRDSPG